VVSRTYIVGVQDRWQYDSATGLLYQSFRRNGAETIVYVDASAGTIRFRGRGAPSGLDPVFADYEPQAYRVTKGGAGSLTPFALQDNRTLSPLAASQTNVVERRSAPLNAGRNWLFWQKGASVKGPASLNYTVRRIGLDLKTPGLVGGMTESETIQLSDRNAQGNQFPVVTGVTVAGAGTVPYEVDYISGKVYVDPQFEGLALTIQYSVVDRAGAPLGSRTATGILTFVDELPQSDADTTGVKVPLRRAVNESQPYAFLDLFAGAGVTRTNPPPANDPTLVLGKVWLFWSSPRGREGSQLVNGIDPFPSGFDLYWQTLAPQFEPLTFPNVFQLP
jgi:hypothetical protein